ncbi:MAG: type II toxin-antitoxin system prevent-host-death family antitoxin [Parvularculaceae bacterium]|nr:type II toxin-antitoxin system prevent-host-death family antitoxin [Parvularculaceae bacterium]
MPKKIAKKPGKAKGKPAQRAAPLAALKRSSAVWSIQDGKDGFSALVEAASEQPQTVTKHGRPAVVVVAVDEFQRMADAVKRPKKNFVEHLLSMPQDDGEFERMPSTFRDIKF